MFTRHHLYQLYEEGREPTIRLIESLLDYIEELKHDPRNRQQRQIADLAERIRKLSARLKRIEEKLARQQCLNYELKCRGCGASLAGGYIVKSESRQVIELPPVRPWVVEHRALTKRCRSCDGLTRGRFPKEVKAAVQYGREVRARAVYLTNYQLLSYWRAGEMMADFSSCHI
jgi:hypothetical protein